MHHCDHNDDELKDTLICAAVLAVTGVALFKIGKFLGRIRVEQELDETREWNAKN